MAPVKKFGREADPAKRLRQSWGAAIREQREMLGLTLEDVAGKMRDDEGCEITAAAIGMWERGETSPKWHHQSAVCRVMGTTRDLIFREVA